MSDHFILRVISKLLIPFIFMYALYVQFHGDFSPGGGFQAGVIFAAAIVLYTLIFGLDRAQKVVPPAVLETLMAAGVLLYAGTGILSLLNGGNYLEYGVLAHGPHHGHHYGIMIVEAGVGIAVASVMTQIFFVFAGRKERS